MQILQEPTTPRRPVILKSERDNSNKEATKEKEKEKQPTIILKTREQSTPKDEIPQSPKISKTSNLEAEGPHPSKIVQNENKEKKTIGVYLKILIDKYENLELF